MKDQFTIYIDRLNRGWVEKIALEVPPETFDLDTEHANFQTAIQLNGQAYLANDFLIIQISIATSVQTICTVCNDPLSAPIDLRNIYITKDLNEYRGATYHFQQDVVEEILLARPAYIECNGGQCPQRDEIKKYLKEN